MAAEKVNSALRPVSHRVERSCDKCGQWDNHPRHLVTDDAGRVHTKHMDCCAEDGCAICTETEQANGGRRGDALIAHLTKGMK